MPHTSLVMAKVKWERTKIRRSAVTAANSASPDARTGTRMHSRMTAPVPPNRMAGRRRDREAEFPVGVRAAKKAPSPPNRLLSSRQNRSQSIAGRNQGREAAPESPMAWTGSSTSSASRFHSRKYQFEPRASEAARIRL